jgi:hypothetical protein
MRHHFVVLITIMVGALVLASSALAFDCIRVSSSLQGLQGSTRSGNWLLFDLSSADAVQQTFAQIGEDVTSAQAQCFAAAYAASGQPLYFALGAGVAGPTGVLAHNNRTSVLGDGRGVDHIEDSPILPAVEAAAAGCGIPLEDG